jgi:parvulin-like peptidyl-prolyl isomerase
VEPTVPADGNPDDVTCKGSYTASDEDVKAAADAVVATVGDKTLTVRELQVYYWMQVQQFMNSESGYYAYYMGAIDMTAPLDTQVSMMEQDLTWQQYFLKEALSAWHTYQVMANEADANGIEISEEIRNELDSIPASLQATATEGGFADIESLIQHNFGANTTLEDYLAFSELYYKGFDYYNVKSQEMTPTDEEITAFFDEHAEDYQESGISKDTKTVDVRHILIMPEGATNETVRTETFPEEAWEAGRVQAQAILDEYLAGETTEENFGTLATKYTQDPGSAETGGLYTGVNQGDMVEAFDAWCFDAARQPGDTDIVKTEFGYHIMYFVDSTAVWKTYAKNDLLAERSNSLLADAAAKYPIEVEYSSIVLSIPAMFEMDTAE